jgi:hypothetical protein
MPRVLVYAMGMGGQPRGAPPLRRSQQTVSGDLDQGLPALEGGRLPPGGRAGDRPRLAQRHRPSFELRTYKPLIDYKLVHGHGQPVSGDASILQPKRPRGRARRPGQAPEPPRGGDAA